MKILILIGAIELCAVHAFAQAPSPTALSTDPQQIQSLIESSGCRYEVSAAAQTIANLQKQINELNTRRVAYINEQMKKNPSAADKAFDEAVRGALCEQAARKGITIPRDR